MGHTYSAVACGLQVPLLLQPQLLQLCQYDDFGGV
jgi:hypothetical protein